MAAIYFEMHQKPDGAEDGEAQREGQKESKELIAESGARVIMENSFNSV